jgi:hypothetical protein
MNCSKLVSVNISEGFKTMGGSVFKNCTSLLNITLPTTLTGSIGLDTFAGCTKLTSLSIPYGVTIFSQGAFQNCNKLTSVTIPNSVTSIGNYAFSNCVLLPSVIIPNSVTSIGNYSFYNCNGLTSLIIPPLVTSIGENALLSVSNNLTFQGNNDTINSMNIPLGTLSLAAHFNFTDYSVYPGSLSSSQLNTNYSSQVSSATYTNALGCFLADSKVLTNHGLIAIQLLKKGDLIQTLNDGLLPIKFVGKLSFFNQTTEERINAHLYKLNKKDFPELKEDLIITGGHPLLVDKNDLDEETKKKLLDMDVPIITEDKYRVFAFIHPKAELWNDEGMKEVFDIVLENEDPHRNYGIYVNGILTESMDEHFFLNYSGMKEINKE